MTPLESQKVNDLQVLLNKRVQAATTKPWVERRKVANELIAAANDTWWSVHSTDAGAYQRDLDLLNSLAGWNDEYKQVAFWKPSGGGSVLMPPKFFGGNPLELDEIFVASMSLNHAVAKPDYKPFAQELAEQQNSKSAFVAHSEYFQRDYAYAKFFESRGDVLYAYAQQRGAKSLPQPADWHTLNQRFAFYIEAFPTRSHTFAKPTTRDFGKEVFVCAINSIVHDIVLRLLRPSRVLLAGQATWDAWPDQGLATHGQDVRTLVRKDGTCKVFRFSGQSSVHGGQTTIVRTNFLRIVRGPNSNEELERLGRDVLAN